MKHNDGNWIRGEDGTREKREEGEPNQLRNWNSMTIFEAGGLGIKAEDESVCGPPEASPSHSITAREEKPLIASVDDCGLGSLS